MPDKCFPPSDFVSTQLCNNTIAHRQVPIRKTAGRVLFVFVHSVNGAAPLQRLSFNTTRSPISLVNDRPDSEVTTTFKSRDEFRAMRRFHFGKEVPILGIFACVVSYCALIALVCAFLHYEEWDDAEDTDEEVDVFEDVVEEIDEQGVREASTQTSPVVGVWRVEKSIQTVVLNEIPLREIVSWNGQSHQSEC
uniref:Transmembrane protein n=1 Tax=Angiostrongylus cantonensis TaxID=6313 RepID=A0A0K0CV73_ANGCA